MLDDCYEYSLTDIAEKLFMHVNTARNLEKSAIKKFKQGLVERGFCVKDFLND